MIKCIPYLAVTALLTVARRVLLNQPLPPTLIGQGHVTLRLGMLKMKV